MGIILVLVMLGNAGGTLFIKYLHNRTISLKIVKNKHLICISINYGTYGMLHTAVYRTALEYF